MDEVQVIYSFKFSDSEIEQIKSRFSEVEGFVNLTWIKNTEYTVNMWANLPDGGCNDWGDDDDDAYSSFPRDYEFDAFINFKNYAGPYYSQKVIFQIFLHPTEKPFPGRFGSKNSPTALLPVQVSDGQIMDPHLTILAFCLHALPALWKTLSNHRGWLSYYEHTIGDVICWPFFPDDLHERSAEILKEGKMCHDCRMVFENDLSWPTQQYIYRILHYYKKYL